MQLTVRDVSKYLNVSDATVTRWIKQRGLPAHHVGGQFRFNRADVLEWATANQMKVSVEMFDHLETQDEPVPTLVEALEAGGIFYHLQGSSKERHVTRHGSGTTITARHRPRGDLPALSDERIAHDHGDR